MRRFFFALPVLLGIAGCASPSITADDIAASVPLQWSGLAKRVAIGAPQLDLRAKTAKGYAQWTKSEPEWNEAARAMATSQLRALLTAQGATVVESMEDADYTLQFEAERTYSAPLTAWDAAGYLALAAVSVPLPGIAIGYGLYKLAGEPCDYVCYNVDNAAAARGDQREDPNRASLSLIAVTGRVVWKHSTKGGDWRNERSAKAALQALLEGVPL